MINKYTEILELYISKNNFSCISFLCLCAILFLFLIITSIRKRGKSRKNVCLAIITFLMFFAVIIVHIVEHSQIHEDLNRAAYEEYIGSFTYGEINDDDSRITLLDTEGNVKLRYDEFYLTKVYGASPFPNLSGELYGQIVYSSKSKIVVYAKIIEKE